MIDHKAIMETELAMLEVLNEVLTEGAKIFEHLDVAVYIMQNNITTGVCFAQECQSQVSIWAQLDDGSSIVVGTMLSDDEKGGLTYQVAILNSEANKSAIFNLNEAILVDFFEDMADLGFDYVVNYFHDWDEASIDLTKSLAETAIGFTVEDDDREMVEQFIKSLDQ